MLGPGLALLLLLAPPPGPVDPADGTATAELPLDVVEEAPAPDAGFLNIATLPWSRVYIDGRYRGVTPLARVALAPGRHQLRFFNEASGLEAFQEVLINPRETTWVRRGLSKGNIGKKLTWVAQEAPVAGEGGVLAVKTAPPTEVWIDGHRRGDTPLEVELPPGRHFVWLINEAAGIEAAKRVQLDPARRVALDLQLEPGAGFLEVDPGLRAEVLVDGAVRGQAGAQPLRLKLPCGPHEVVVRSRAAGLELKRTVQVRLGETTRVELALTARGDLEADRVSEDEIPE